MPILVVTKLLLGNYMQFRSIYHIKEVPSKILYFGHSGPIMRSKLGCVTIYGHTFIAYNSVIFGPIPKKIIQGYSGDDYLPDLLGYFLGGLGVQLNSAPGDAYLRARPSRKARKSQRLRNFTKSSPYGWGFLVNPYLQTEFSQKFRVNPPPPP